MGSPEGELAIADAVVYLACAPKSNAVYVAMGEAHAGRRAFGTLEVPLQLRNAPDAADEEPGPWPRLSLCAR